MWPECAWCRSDERARHRCAARYRCGAESWVAACATQELKRFVWVAHVASPSFEAGEFLQERQRNFPDRTIALFRNNQFGFACFFRTRFFILLINFWPNE